MNLEYTLRWRALTVCFVFAALATLITPWRYSGHFTWPLLLLAVTSLAQSEMCLLRSGSRSSRKAFKGAKVICPFVIGVSGCLLVYACWLAMHSTALASAALDPLDPMFQEKVQVRLKVARQFDRVLEAVIVLNIPMTILWIVLRIRRQYMERGSLISRP